MFIILPQSNVIPVEMIKDVTKISDIKLKQLLKKYSFYVKALESEVSRRKKITVMTGVNTVEEGIPQVSGQSAKIAKIKKLMNNNDTSALNRSGRIEKPKLHASIAQTKAKSMKRIKRK